MRRNWLRVGSLVVTLAAAFAVVPAFPASADTIPATRYPSVSLADMAGPNYLLTQPDGSVTAGCSGGTIGTKRVSAAGVVVQNIPNAVPYPYTCARNSAVGVDGTLFTVATTAMGWPTVQAIKGGVVRWTYSFACLVAIRGMVVGTNGNLYVLSTGLLSPCNGQSTVLGFKPTAIGATPTVVMNKVVANNVVDGGLASYNNGLALRLANGVQYVKYDGTVNTPIVANLLGGVLQNAFDAVVTSGRVFVPLASNQVTITACSNDVNVVSALNAYEPSGLKWSYTALPACSEVNELRPTYGGGVILRLVAPTGGIPGARKVESLLALSANGVAIWQMNLAQPDPTAIDVWNTYAVDTNGNVALMRSVRYRLDANGAQYWFPAIQLQLVDGFTGGILSSYELSGDHTTPDGSGYAPYGGADIAISRNTWYVSAVHCWIASNCDTSTAALYAITVPRLQIDYPRGAVLASAMPWKNYVALGDSYSSGEGVPPFIAPSDSDGCHRSGGAYAQLLNNAPSSRLKLTASPKGFVACSGSKTQDVGARGRNGEPKQINALNTSTDLVTITIGGNNVKFKEFATACVMPDTSCSGINYMNIIGRVHDQLPSELDTLFAQIKAKINVSRATVLVIGYPLLMPEPSVPTTTPDCWYMDSAEKTAARDVITQLNQAVHDAVTRANAPFQYVDVNYPQSPFKGHELCNPGSYFNGITTWPNGPTDATFHPNADGQSAYRQIIENYLS